MQKIIDNTNNVNMGNRSFYISTDRQGSDFSNEAEVHVNLIRNYPKNRKGHKNANLCIDFGLGLKPHTDAYNIYFYAPFYIPKKVHGKPEGIVDLGKILVSNRETVSAVFNENIDVRQVESSPSFYALHIGGKESARKVLYVLDSTSFEFIPLDVDEKGTLIKITIPKLDNWPPADTNTGGEQPSDEHEAKGNGKPDLYIRFRIITSKKNGVRSLQQSERLYNNVIKGAFEITDLFDIRINDVRVSETKVLEKMCNGNQSSLLQFNKVHFFYITDVKEIVAARSSSLNDVRMLEDDTWSVYLNGIEDEKMRIAYHWKSTKISQGTNTNPMKEYCVFFSSDNKDFDILQLTRYCLMVILLGFLGSLLVEVVKKTDSCNLIGIVSIIGVILIICFSNVIIKKAHCLCRWFCSRIKK